MVSSDYLAVKQEEEFNRREITRTDLTNYFKNISEKQLRSKPLHEILINQNWYFIHFQTFCKSDVNPYDDEHNYNPYYVLAEVALIEYSLRHGIVNTYQAFIPANKIPLGYRSQCMESQRDVHQIPIDKFDQVNKSYGEIYNDIDMFVQKKIDNNHYTPLFCMSKDYELSKFGIRFLFDQSKSNTNASTRCPLIEKIFDLEFLVSYLSEQAKRTISIASANEILTAFSYDYAGNTLCEYHESLSCIKCSLGFLKRYAYLISDSICQMYGVELTDAHMPLKEENVGVEVYYSGREDFNSGRSRNRFNGSMSRGSSVFMHKRMHEESMNANSISESLNEPLKKHNNFKHPSPDIRYRAPYSLQQQLKQSQQKRLISDKFETMTDANSSLVSRTTLKSTTITNVDGAKSVDHIEERVFDYVSSQKYDDIDRASTFYEGEDDDDDRNMQFDEDTRFNAERNRKKILDHEDDDDDSILNTKELLKKDYGWTNLSKPNLTSSRNQLNPNKDDDAMSLVSGAKSTISSICHPDGSTVLSSVENNTAKPNVSAPSVKNIGRGRGFFIKK